MKCIKCSKETGAEWKTLCRSCWKNQSPDEIRAYRQKKIDRKVERLLKKADKLDRKAEVKTSCMDQYHGDIAFFTQPAKENSSFGKYRARLYERSEKGFAMMNEAKELREKAEWIQSGPARVKGDAERERQEKREQADNLYKKGSKVYDFCFRDGEIVRVNKKTFTIKFQSGGTYTRDKSFFV